MSHVKYRKKRVKILKPLFEGGVAWVLYWREPQLYLCLPGYFNRDAKQVHGGGDLFNSQYLYV